MYCTHWWTGETEIRVGIDFLNNSPILTGLELLLFFG